ncbi:MAG: polyprenyl diphosphate synthase [Magnetococcus sp. DMHC-6]
MAKSNTIRIPRHIAIVMDGNRRWARSRFLPRIEGHRRGVQAVRRTVEACIDLKVPILTLYTFSSENWNRPAEEVSALMGLLAHHLRNEMMELIQEGVQFRALGRIYELPLQIQELIHEMEEKTRHNSILKFNIAINYGGRQEIVDVARQLVKEGLEGRLAVEEINEAQFLRTGGEQRISNFLLWQLAYTEMVFLPIFWPEFSKKDLEEAIAEFSRRERRFGADH